MGFPSDGDIPRGTLDSFVEAFFATSGRDTAAVVPTYRRNRPDASVLDLMLAVGTDGWNRIPAIRLAEAQLAHGPVFFYRFDWPSPANGGRMGACHALELPFVFETVDCATAITLTGGAAPPALVAATHAGVGGVCA